MNRTISIIFAAILAGVWAAPAQADEVFGGVYIHDISSPLSLSNVEDGMDVQLGWRGDPSLPLKLQPHAFVSVNTAGQTHFAAIGLSRKFGDKIFIRPGLGIAIHTGSAEKYQDETNNRIEFGSRVLFEPELGIGARLNPRLTIEASLVHLSHAQLFGKQNPGLDTLGIRLSYKL